MCSYTNSNRGIVTYRMWRRKRIDDQKFRNGSKVDASELCPPPDLKSFTAKYWSVVETEVCVYTAMAWSGWNVHTVWQVTVAGEGSRNIREYSECMLAYWSWCASTQWYQTRIQTLFAGLQSLRILLALAMSSIILLRIADSLFSC